MYIVYIDFFFVFDASVITHLIFPDIWYWYQC